jgi:hypothetical protein
MFSGRAGLPKPWSGPFPVTARNHAARLGGQVEGLRIEDVADLHYTSRTSGIMSYPGYVRKGAAGGGQVFLGEQMTTRNGIYCLQRRFMIMSNPLESAKEASPESTGARQ